MKPKPHLHTISISPFRLMAQAMAMLSYPWVENSTAALLYPGPPTEPMKAMASSMASRYPFVMPPPRRSGAASASGAVP